MKWSTVLSPIWGKQFSKKGETFLYFVSVSPQGFLFELQLEGSYVSSKGWKASLSEKHGVRELEIRHDDSKKEDKMPKIKFWWDSEIKYQRGGIKREKENPSQEQKQTADDLTGGAKTEGEQMIASQEMITNGGKKEKEIEKQNQANQNELIRAPKGQYRQKRCHLLCPCPGRWVWAQKNKNKNKKVTKIKNRF